jgi:hypothetical protein
MSYIPVTPVIIAAAQALLDSNKPSAYRDRLRAIVRGKVKSINTDWWRREHDCELSQLAKEQDKGYARKLAKIRAMIDPAGNSNPHQREVAAAMLTKLQASRPAVRVRYAPGLEEFDREIERSRAEQLDIMNAAFARYKEKEMAKAAAKAARTDSVAQPKPAPKAKPTNIVAQPKARTDSVAASKAKPTAQPKASTDSVAAGWLTRRTKARALARAGLKCLACGKPLAAARSSMRYCNTTCRSHAFRGKI